jgi:hypothetical protein
MNAPSELERKTREWLDYALHDLVAGEWDLQCQTDLFEDCYFHAQQAAEKALKAWLLWNNVPFRKTHDIKELILQCQGIGPELDAVAARSRALLHSLHWDAIRRWCRLGRRPAAAPNMPYSRLGNSITQCVPYCRLRPAPDALG